MREQVMSLDVLEVPAGFVTRPCGLEDAGAVAELRNALTEKLTGFRPQTGAKVVLQWESPNFVPATATMGVWAEDSGQLVAYTAVWDTDSLPVQIWWDAGVQPAYEGLGLGSALLRWSIERSKQAFGRVPEGLQVKMITGILEQHTTARALFTEHGWQHVRNTFRMTIELNGQPIPEPQLAEGLTIRSWAEIGEALSLREIMVATNEAFRDHWGYVDQPEEEQLSEWQHWVDSNPDFHPSRWFFALAPDPDRPEGPGQIAGMSLCDPKSRGQEGWGYVDTLGVRRPWRKQGLGLALLHHTFRHFAEQGFARVELHVDASSLTGATRLYERAGMHVSEQSEEWVFILRPGEDVSTQTV